MSLIALYYVRNIGYIYYDVKQITHQQQGMNFVFQDHKTDTNKHIITFYYINSCELQNFPS
jgi:hypothetical protein